MTAKALALVVVAAALAGTSSAAPGAVDADPHVTRWTYVLGPVTARTAPSWSAKPMTVVRRATPEGESNLWSSSERHATARAGPGRASGSRSCRTASTGWVPRESLGEVHVVRTRLVVDRTRLTAVLYRRGHAVFRARVGVGTAGWPTPRGTFYVRQRLTRFGDPFYGPVAFGLSARSAVLTDWPGGGYVGIHGTNCQSSSRAASRTGASGCATRTCSASPR